MSPYRIAPEKEPPPKKPFWCKLGLHAWRTQGFTYAIASDIPQKCDRCDATRILEFDL
jgi:hypothetical protein